MVAAVIGRAVKQPGLHAKVHLQVGMHEVVIEREPAINREH